MMCAVTVRQLRPGSYERFREAWEPTPWPEQLVRAIVSRNEQEPDQVLTASFFDVHPSELELLRDEPELLNAEDRRLARIADFEAAIVFKGIFEVAEELVAPSERGG
jgi:hypothetical protein